MDLRDSDLVKAVSMQCKGFEWLRHDQAGMQGLAMDPLIEDYFKTAGVREMASRTHAMWQVRAEDNNTSDILPEESGHLGRG
jgi:hypothetical protein